MSFLTRALRRLGRSIEPLVAPDAEARRERDKQLAALVKEQRAAVKDLGKQVATQRRELKRAQDARASELTDTRERLADVRVGVRRQSHALVRLARRAGIEAEFELTEQRVLDRLARLRHSGRPIIVGPWTGEMGFELLYWIPFVRWAVEKYDLPPDLLTIVSRGGTSAWYEGLGGKYVDVFSLATPDEFRAKTEAVKKQRFMGAFDREILRRVRKQQGSERAGLLHPALMYALFMPFWKHQAPLTRVTDHTVFRRIAPGPRPKSMPKLPSRYAAVRFYFSGCFPDTPENRAFVSRVVGTLAEQSDVVMLNPGFRTDDHEDYSPAVRAHIHTVDMSGHASENLAWQTAIIAGATSYVGTYGGFAYLAPFCGVDAISFYSDRTYFTYHMELAHKAFADAGGGRLDAIDVRTAGALAQILADAGANGSAALPAAATGGTTASARKRTAKLEAAEKYEFYWYKAHKKIEIRDLEGFGQLAAKAVEDHRTGMRQDRLYTLWQAIASLPAGNHAIAEVGAFKGGSARFIGEALQWHRRTNPFFVCDTFTGHAVVDEALDGPHKVGEQFMDTSVEDVRAYLEGLPSLTLVEGDFRETSRQLDAQAPFAFAHIDVDVYPVTKHALEFFAPRLLPGSTIVVDDYGFTTCRGARQAVEEFTSAHPEFRMFHLLTGQALLAKLA